MIMILSMFNISVNFTLPFEVKRGVCKIVNIKNNSSIGEKEITNGTSFSINIPIKERIANPYLYKLIVETPGIVWSKPLLSFIEYPLIYLNIPKTVEQGENFVIVFSIEPLTKKLTRKYNYNLYMDNKKIANGTVKKNITLELVNKYEIKEHNVKVEVYDEGIKSTNAMTFDVVLPGIKTMLITDKPIYQPSQEIHIRALLLRGRDKTPIANKELILKIIEPEGNIVLQKEIKTDGFGIAYYKFKLADRVNTGNYSIEIINKKSSSVLAQKNIQVKYYKLPAFKINLKTNKEFYMPGEILNGTVNINYFFLKPVAFGKVNIAIKSFDAGMTTLKEIKGTLDSKGTFNFSYKLPDYFVGLPLDKGKGMLFLNLTCEDKTGHFEEKSFSRTVVKKSIDIKIIPLGGRLVKNRENRVFITATYPDGKPAKGNILFNSKTFRLRDGLVETTIKPRKSTQEINITFKDEKNRIFKEEISLKAIDKDDILIVPERFKAKSGEKLRIDIFSKASYAYFEVLKENHRYLTKTVRIENGKAKMSITLPDELSGSALLFAYAIDRDGNIVRDKRIIYVEPAKDINITVKKKRSYKPGEYANLIFKTTAAGRPISAAIGLSIVDEAVYALSELHPGLEKIFFEIENEILKPRFEIHGLSWDLVITQPEEKKVDLFLSLVNMDSELPIDLPENNIGRLDLETKAVLDSLLDTLYTKIENIYYNHYSEIVNSENKENLTPMFINNGWLKRKELIDPYGGLVKLSLINGYELTISVGSELKAATIRNRRIVFRKIRRFEPEEDIMSIKGVEPTFANGKDGAVRKGIPTPVASEKEATSEGSVHVRSYFPETFIFNPALITNSNGIATLNVNVPDAITTYRMTMLASSKSGYLGSKEDSITIFQPFFVKPDIPSRVIRNDEISLRVGIYNYLKKDITVKVKITSDENITFKETEKTVSLKAEDVSSVYFPMKALKAGKAKIRIDAISNTGDRDAVIKYVNVYPPGIEKELTESGILNQLKTFKINFPENADREARETYIRIYPGALADVLTGLENLLRMPYGCFEQTSSITYPNILILNYLREKRMNKPEIELKAETYINLGYQRLISYEVKGGGFSWFGNTPANKILTAYGLREFYDMKDVYTIDKNLIERTLNWLISEQNADGSFSPDEDYINEEVTVGLEQPGILPTAYISWTFSEIGYNGRAARKAKQYLLKHLDEAKDPYEYALLLNAFVGEKTFERIFKKLMILSKREKDVIYWESNVPTMTYGRGISRNIEITGLVVNALLRGRKHNDIAKLALNYIYKNRDQYGTWHTTQATIIALKDIILAEKITAPVEGKIEIVYNNRIKTMKIKPNDAQMQFVKIPSQVKEFHVNFTGKGSPVYEVVRTWYEEAQIKNKEELLNINVSFDRESLPINDLLGVSATIKTIEGYTAKMVIVDLGIPPGFSPLSFEWEQMKKDKSIEDYSFTGRQIIVYFDELKNIKTLKYHLRAMYPLKITGVNSRVYEYYSPENENFSKPIPVEAK